MSRTEVLICGFGGQGVIFAGELIGRAGMIAGMEAAQSSAYGSEARGSSCSTGVVLSDELIGYPIVRKPDVLIALSQDGYEKFAPSVKGGGIIFYDSDMVEPASMEGIDQQGIPATTKAASIGRKGVANVVMLAEMVRITRILSLEVLEKSIAEQSPDAFRSINLKAIRLTY